MDKTLILNESDIFSNYKKYFIWNNALIDHYLSDKSGQEIMLYVDRKVLAEIGETYRIHIDEDIYEDDFIKTVECFCKYYNQYINACKQSSQSTDRHLRPITKSGKKSKVYCRKTDCKYYVFNSYCLPWDDRNDVLAVAKHICCGGNNGIAYFKKDSPLSLSVDSEGRPIRIELPFFAIVIYIILRFDNGKTQQWDNVGGIKISSREYIKDLWEAISSLYPSFKKDASAYIRVEGQNEDYVGRIKYHILLSSSIRRKLNDAIYKTKIWKFYDTMSFAEQKSRLLSSNKDLKKFFSDKKIDSAVFDRQLQVVIENFDYEDYLNRLEERKRNAEFKQTRSTNERFALAISYPERNEEGNPAIRLLTTVHQQTIESDYYIQECVEGSLDGFNVNYVQYKNSDEVKLEEHSLKSGDYAIKSLPVKDVVFFYGYSDSLYIQTCDTTRTGCYLIFVRNTERVLNGFTERIANLGDTHLVKYSVEETNRLFGNNWVVYYSKKSLGVQYYSDIKPSLDNKHEFEEKTDTIIFRDEIKNKNGKYFVQALPFLEIPESYGELKNVNIKIKINDGNKEYEHDLFSKIIIKGRKLAIDLRYLPTITNDMSCMISLILQDKEIPVPCLGLTGQDIEYDQQKLYKYDAFGRRVCDDSAYSFAGNIINNVEPEQAENFILTKVKGYVGAVNSMRFINLLSAKCYNNLTSEISNSGFMRCLNYISSRFGINIQDLNFVRDLKIELSQAGYINRDYSNSKIQIIPPLFTKIPRSGNGYSQFIMLSGSYTRKFIDDLYNYCEKKNISISQIEHKTRFKELIPPTILISSPFNARDFVETYHHQCDILVDQDYALSLLKSSVDADTAFKKFTFVKYPDISMLNLKPVKGNSFPRIREDNNRHNVHYYIEQNQNKIAVVEKSLLSWAYLYCHAFSNRIMAISHMNNIYVHKRMILPFTIQRPLWMMNLDDPTLLKTFILDGDDHLYYEYMYLYKLGSEKRVSQVVAKLNVKNVKNGVRERNMRINDFNISFWDSYRENQISNKKYLILYDNHGNVMAAGCNSKAYICIDDRLHVVEGGMNKVLSFLITHCWRIKDSSVYYYAENKEWTKYQDISKEFIPIPRYEDYQVEKLTIL